MSPLPAPDPAALEHSQKTAALIRAEITTAGGWISFSRYMELALYTPGLGYYSAGLGKFGTGGDFVTAPEISVLFGQTLARQATQVLELSADNILEIGAGSGRLAFDLLTELEQQGQLPERYFILEVSADLRQRQQKLLERFAPGVEWLDSLPDSFSGLIIGNEVLDAMPAHLVVWREGNIYERGVICEGHSFQWNERKLISGALFDIASQLAPAHFSLPFKGREGVGMGSDSMDTPPIPHLTSPLKGEGLVEKIYVSEINLAARGIIASLAEMLDKGAILMLDYGFGQNEYYHPQRSAGTLMCHYRHYAHDDPFHLPGLQDITAHVDFSAIAETGINHGLSLLGYTSQTHFLINNGITDLLTRVSPEQAGVYLPLASQAQKLLSPAEMGELFKVIALGKGIHTPLTGFSQGDKSRLL